MTKAGKGFWARAQGITLWTVFSSSANVPFRVRPSAHFSLATAITDAIAIVSVWLSETCHSWTPWCHASCAATPATTSVGFPDGSWRTLMSVHVIPALSPVPRAFIAASLAANRAAMCSA